ncbi:Bicoid-interacting protein 3-domain-containing protein [Rhodotorula diobovata]|uniref:RNA methyltransferase n=1 Tax=Rhodotorula diobovata TaxID=5288 RepID=A0A5C5G0M5_9BASI|nr:Bicoid-interacting protein 3-domain-containing protein [Rhodotorula diobovata]
MSHHQPDPHAKRQRASFFDTAPNLNPVRKPPPALYQPSSSSTLPSLADHDPSSSTHHNKAHQSTTSSKKRERPSAPNGNFRGYYARRRGVVALGPVSAPDERLALIPAAWLEGKKVLDVGCNGGVVTVEVAQTRRAARVTGVDIDAELVRAARKQAELAWSRQKPLQRLVDEAAHLSHGGGGSSSRSRSPSPGGSSRSVLPPLVLDDTTTSPFSAPSSSSSSSAPHFPLSLPRMFGFLPHPRGLVTMYHPQSDIETVGVLRRGKRRVMPIEVRAFPDNVRFVHADWVNEEIPDDREGYDVILALSITKWIHLRSLNVGLLTFFRRCFDALLPGGRLVLEPQPFSTYARSARASGEATLRDNYARLVEGAEKGWRAEEGDFERVLIELVGFEKRDLLGETGKIGSTFRRPVEVYTKRGGGSWGV